MVEALERAIGNATAVASGITGWENRWGTRNLVDQHPDGVSARAKAVLAKSEAMTVADYRALLRERAHAQLTPRRSSRQRGRCRDHAVLPRPRAAVVRRRAGQAAAPAPDRRRGLQLPKLDAVCACVTVPLLGVGGMPVGVQLMGQQHQDERIVGLARWLVGAVAPVVVA